MKIFGSIKELVSAVFRKNSQEVTVQPNGGTYTGPVTLELPPVLSGSDIVLSENATQAMTNKTIDGDNNTLQDMPVTIFKTVAGDADKVILRNGSGATTSAKIVNANIDNAAAIADSKLATISTAGKVSNSATTATSSNTASAIVARDSSGNFSAGTITATLSGSATSFSGSLSGEVTGTQSATVVADGVIDNANIMSNAAIAHSKLANMTSGQVLLGNSSNVPTSTTVTGDVTISNTGVAAIGSSKVTNTMLAGSIDLTTKVTGALPIANGGSGQTTQQAAMNALAGTQTANRVLRSDGTNTTLSQVALATDVSGTLPIANGGSGQTTANAALNAFLPSQTSNTGKVLQTDGTNTSWASVPANGSTLLAADGTVSAPGISFNSDTNTGLYRIGADNVGFSANGVKVGEYNSTGNWTLTGRSTAGNSKIRAFLTANTTITTATDTEVVFNDKSTSGKGWDTNSEFNTSTGRFTPTKAGYYLVTAQCQIGVIDNGKAATLQVYRNGVTGDRFAISAALSGVSADAALNATGLVYCNGTTDYISVFVYHNKGSNATLYGGSSSTSITIVEIM